MNARHLRSLFASAAFASAILEPGMIAQAYAQVATIRVPAGALEPALLALGQQAGLTFAYDSTLTAGRSTKGASGSLTPQAAVAEVLEGTGLSFSFTGARSVVIAAPVPIDASALGSVLLDTITVEAVGSVTEGSGLYTFNAPTTTATGLPLTPRETPQSVSVVTNQQIVDAGDVVLKDTLNQTPGINTAAGYGDGRWNFYARGSQVSNLQYDGLTLPVAWWGQEASPDDMVIYDRIEVVRGATGLMEGPGNPSASINLVRKRPFTFGQTSLDVTAYDYGSGSVTVDTSQPLNAARTVRGRFIGYGLTGDTWREAQSRDSTLVYAAVDIDLSDSTALGLGLSYQNDRIDGYAWGGFWARPDGGAYDFRPTDNSAAAWEYLTREETVAYADLIHRLDNGWALRLAGRLADSDRDRFAGSNGWTDPETLVRDGYLSRGYETSATLGATANGSIDLFGRKHDLAFGADWSRLKSGMEGSNYYVLPTLDPSRPDTWAHPRPDGDDTVTWKPDDITTQWGIFASGRFEVSPTLHVIAGGRLAWYDYQDKSGDPTNPPMMSSGYSVDAKFIPYLGAVYDINDTFSVYASYTEIFRPLAERSISDSQLDPALGTNAEIGMKAGFLDGGLEASLALFNTEIDGLPEAVEPRSLCPRPQDGCYRAAETVTTRGVDFEVSGAPADGWNVSLGYTYADSAYSAGPNDGKRYESATVPRHLGKVSGTYAFAGQLAGLTIGGALRAQSGIYSDGISATGDDFRQSQPGYGVVDAMARYAFTPETSLQVNIDNVFDRVYLTGVDASWAATFFGAPRTVSLALRHVF
jgi:outer membrane receptor for ferric coprogen and ferric-rhodotorulic acid